MSALLLSAATTGRMAIAFAKSHQRLAAASDPAS